MVISLFGAFALNVNDVAVTSFRSNKVRSLLVYLLLAQPQPLLRTAISELLWTGYAEQSAQTNLRQALTNLRDCLAPFDLLQSTRTHLRLHHDPATLWCDVHQFETLLDACQRHAHRTLADCDACRSRLQAAVALYQAPLLEHFPQTDSKPFNAWLLRQRERLAERLAVAQAALTASATVRGNLPPPLTSLVGRTHELTALAEKLQDDVYRCVSLIGPGGIGKTRLAVAAGARLQEEFPDGVWLVELGGLAPITPAEPPAQLHDRLSTAIGQALRLAFAGVTPPTEQVANHLAAKTALLILDSFEHLAAGAAWLPTLLTAAPRLHLLITSRHRPPLQSQFVFPLAGLGVPPDAVVNEQAASHLLAQYAGVQLFMGRAAADEALILAEPLGIAKLMVRSYYALAVVAWSESQFERSLRLGEKGAHLARQQELWHEEAFCASIAGIAATTHQGLTTVHPQQTQALLLLEAHQDTRQALRFRANLASIYRGVGDFSAALHYFEQNLAFLRLQDDSYTMALTQLNLGALLWLLGDYDAAAAALVESRERLEMLGQKRLLAQCLALLGALRLAQGNYAAAAAACRQALDHPHILRGAQQIAWLTLGDLHQAQGEFAAAESAYNQIVASTQAQHDAAWWMAQGALATLRLAREGAAAALTALEALLPHLDRARFDTVFTAQCFLLSAYQIFVANADQRAPAILQQAWRLVQAQLTKIDDPRLRHTFLTNVPVNRTLGQFVGALSQIHETAC